jgi:hypothetical protein
MNANSAMRNSQSRSCISNTVNVCTTTRVRSSVRSVNRHSRYTRMRTSRAATVNRTTGAVYGTCAVATMPIANDASNNSSKRTSVDCVRCTFRLRCCYANTFNRRTWPKRRSSASSVRAHSARTIVDDSTRTGARVCRARPVRHRSPHPRHRPYCGRRRSPV